MFGKSRHVSEKGEPRQKKAFYGLRGQKLQWAVGTVAGLAFCLLVRRRGPDWVWRCALTEAVVAQGYDQGVMGGILTLPSFLAVIPEVDTTTTTGAQNQHNSIIQGAMIGLYEIGCMLGALSCLYWGDRLGRRRTLFAGGSIMIVGAIIQTSSYSLAQIIVGRIIAGLGNGLNTATVPTYQSECAQTHHRGKLMMIQGALITLGIMISYWLDLAFSFLDPSTASWRVPIGLQMVFAVLIVSFVMGLPESPRWLVKVGRIDEARESFAALLDIQPDDERITREIKEIQYTLRITESGTLKNLVHNGPLRHAHRAMLGYVNQCFQQISGINLVTYYAATIYQTNLNLSPTLSRILAAANGTEYFLASWIPYFLVERVGRRKLMFIGSAGQASTMAILAGCAYLVQTENNQTAAKAAAAFLFVFNSYFAVGWLALSWLYPAEVVSLQARAPANGVSTASNWAFNFLIVMITPVAFSTIGFQTYTCFAIINFAILIASYFLFPETAGRSLEEMDVVFEQATGIWSAVKIARDTKPTTHHDLEEREGITKANGEKLDVQLSNGEKPRTEQLEQAETPTPPTE